MKLCLGCDSKCDAGGVAAEAECSILHSQLSLTPRLLGPYNTIDYPITIVVIPIIYIVVPLLPHVVIFVPHRIPLLLFLWLYREIP